jgi:uncharacterized DUF497 family protein
VTHHDAPHILRVARVTFGDEFDWDDAKAASNVAKHGVSLVEGVCALDDRRAVAFADS